MDKPEKSITPKFKIGDIVKIKSYPSELVFKGHQDSQPPLMIVVGIEVESKQKRTHDEELGVRIADRIKYEVLWFDNRQSRFISKIMYEAFLIRDSEKVAASSLPKYEFGGVVLFKTAPLEKLKKKAAHSYIEKKSKPVTGNRTVYSILSFVCPSLILTTIKKNTNKSTHFENGEIKTVKPQTLVKVMWYNWKQQKYSEYELPMEALIFGSV
jgi:hypothetical protein